MNTGPLTQLSSQAHSEALVRASELDRFFRRRVHRAEAPQPRLESGHALPWRVRHPRAAVRGT